MLSFFLSKILPIIQLDANHGIIRRMSITSADILCIQRQFGLDLINFKFKIMHPEIRVYRREAFGFCIFDGSFAFLTYIECFSTFLHHWFLVAGKSVMSQEGHEKNTEYISMQYNKLWNHHVNSVPSVMTSPNPSLDGQWWKKLLLTRNQIW